ncbi:MAG: hypothetical protein ABI206_15875 [Antricoccus sp.]
MSSEDAEDLRGSVAGAAEPVWHRGVERGDLARYAHIVRQWTHDLVYFTPTAILTHSSDASCSPTPSESSRALTRSPVNTKLVVWDVDCHRPGRYALTRREIPIAQYFGALINLVIETR